MNGLRRKPRIPIHHMKHILGLLTVLSVVAFTAPSAKADHSNRRVVSYTSCGRPVYASYQVYGYDRCGNPIGRWVTESSYCGCEVCHPRPRYYSQQPSYYQQPSYQSHGHGFSFSIELPRLPGFGSHCR